MALWTNFVSIAAPRNATTTHAVASSAGTVAGGTLFTSTAGSLLMIVGYGPVTFTTPAGWTLQGSVINNGGLYVWTKTAAGGASDDVSFTHNGSDYAVNVSWFEFPSGSTYVNEVTSSAVAAGGANANLTGLAGTPLVVGVKCSLDDTTGSTATGVWTGPTVELLDTNVDRTAPVDGHWVHIGYIENYASASYQPTSTRSGTVGATCETMTIAVNVSGGAADPVPPYLIMAPMG